ncbi:MAG: RHS repeat-associated core domain-containing protein [Pseudomonadota bacterium]
MPTSLLRPGLSIFIILFVFTVSPILRANYCAPTQTPFVAAGPNGASNLPIYHTYDADKQKVRQRWERNVAPTFSSWGDELLELTLLNENDYSTYSGSWSYYYKFLQSSSNEIRDCPTTTPPYICTQASWSVVGYSRCINGFRLSGSTCIESDSRFRECPTIEKPAKNRGCSPNNVGNPCNSGNGNKYHREGIYRSGGSFPLEFSLTFNSAEEEPWQYRFGENWRHSFDARILGMRFASTTYRINDVVTGPDQFVVYSPEGNVERFIHQDNGQITNAEADARGRLEIQADFKLLYTDASGAQTLFDINGEILESRSNDGIVITYQHINPTNNQLQEFSKLESVTDQFGRTITFYYDGNDRIWKITDPANNEYLFAYANGNLSTITYPDLTPGVLTDNPVKLFHYEDTNHPNFLTGVTDERGLRTSTYTYHSDGKVATSQRAGGVDFVDLTYNPGVTTVVDAFGESRDFHYGVYHGVLKLQQITSITGNVTCEHCKNKFKAATYDANGNLATSTDFNDNITLYKYSSDNLQECRVEGLPGPGIDPAMRKFVTEWDSSLRRRTKVTLFEAVNQNATPPTSCDDLSFNWDPFLETSFTYVDRRLKTETKKSLIGDATPDPDRITTYTYFGETAGDPTILNGLLKRIDGPRTDVNDYTDFEYRTTTTADYTSGDLWKVVNALGHETEFTKYDVHGRPIELEDTNDVVTQFTYHPRGWLTTRNVDGQTTEFMYDDAGLVSHIVLPDDSALAYSYDGAQRLEQIEEGVWSGGVFNGSGDVVKYTLNAYGGREIEETLRGGISGTLKRKIERVYNNLNQLDEILAYVTNTTYNQTDLAQDQNGNVTQTTDPRDPSIFTASIHDALERVITTNNKTPNGTTAEILTTFRYDALDNVVEVTDPNGNDTDYLYNGFSDLEQLTSPDTGITTYIYDEGGNQVQQTDARAIVTNYSYDALNRLTLIDYPADTDTSFTFDESAGINGIGRLTTMTDESGTTQWTYHPRGTVASRSHDTVQNSVTHRLTTSYTYDDADRINTMTYPSGMVVTYNRDGNGRVDSIAVSGAPNISGTIVSNIQYEPFGPPHTMNLMNGISETRTYDLSYRLKSIDSSDPELRSYAFDYDAADNVEKTTTTYEAPLGTPIAHIQNFQYDDLSRLTYEDNTAATNIGEYYSANEYEYDFNGNRIRHKAYDDVGALANDRPYAMVPGTNKVASAFLHDAAGNMTFNNKTNTTLVYNDAGRPKESIKGSTLRFRSLYNGLGERVEKEKTDAPLTYVYHYDELGRMHSAAVFYTGTLIYHHEYVFLEDRPVAEFYTGPNAAWNRISFMHLNQVNQLKYMTKETGEMNFLHEAANAFGQKGLENFNPDGDSLSNHPIMRGFPGQIWDSEIGAHQNYFRDYSPFMGRYTQSDPIGLGGGLNTYAYARNNPTTLIDPFGLDPAINCINDNGTLDLACFIPVSEDAFDAAMEHMAETGAECAECASMCALESAFGDFIVEIGSEITEEVMEDIGGNKLSKFVPLFKKALKIDSALGTGECLIGCAAAVFDDRNP